METTANGSTGFGIGELVTARARKVIREYVAIVEVDRHTNNLLIYNGKRRSNYCVCQKVCQISHTF